MSDKVTGNSFVPSGSDGLNSAAKPRMKGKNKAAPAGNAGSSASISGAPGVLKKVNSMGTFKSGHKK